MKKRVMAILLCLCLLAALIPSTGAAAAPGYGETPYTRVTGPLDGGTFVFFSEISNNLSKSDPAERLLTADTKVPSNQKGTSTTDFYKDENNILWGGNDALADYRFTVTKLSGVLDIDNQGYTIKHEKTGKYLDVTQDFQITKQKGSSAQFMRGDQATVFDGEIFPTMAYVCFSDTPRTWYWEDATRSFYTVYSSDLANFGTAVTLAGSGQKLFMQVYNGGYYLVNWGRNCAYASDIDMQGYPSLSNYQRHYRANFRMYLRAVNSGNGQHTEYSNNLAEVLHNPLYYFYDMYPMLGRGGCASLSVQNGGNLYSPQTAGVYGTYAEIRGLQLYREMPLYELTVNNGTGSGTYPEGTSVEISAEPSTAAGHFVRWDILSGTGTISSTTSASTKMKLSANTVIQAVYEGHTLSLDDGDCTTEEVCTECHNVVMEKYDAHHFETYTTPEPGSHSSRCANPGCTKAITESCTFDKAANCLSPQVCNVCGVPFGEKDPANHEGEAVWQQTATTHKQVYNCCGGVKVAETEHTWENGRCTVCEYVCGHRGGSASYFEPAVCEICGEGYGSLLTDSTPPTGEICVSDNKWKSFLNHITFGMFFHETQRVTITAHDDSETHTGYAKEDAAKIEYYLHSDDDALTEEEIAAKTFTGYDGGFNIDPDNKYVIYARITDHAGNVTYINSDGMILDASAPTIPDVDTNGYETGKWLTSGSVTFTISGSEALSGIAKYQYSTDKGVNWTDMTITNGSASLVAAGETKGADYRFRAVSNSGVESAASAPVIVNIDKTAPDGDIKFEENSVKKAISQISFGLFFNKNIDVEITGTDEVSGIAKIEYYRSDEALTEEEAASISNWTETTGKFSITAEDKVNFIYYVKITDEAGNTTCFGSGGATFDLMSPVISGIENGETCYVTQSVTVADDHLDSVVLNGEPVGTSLSLAGNKDAVYTISAADKAGNVTEYTVTMRPIEKLGEPIKGLTTENVTSDDQETVEELKETIASVDTGDAAEEEKMALRELADQCDELLAKIDEVAKAIEDIETRLDDYTIQTITFDDESDLKQLKEDIEQVLADYDGNLTKNEKLKLGEWLQSVEEMLDSLKNVEKIENIIHSLPDTVEPDDTDMEQRINDAKKQYDALTVHEKSLVSEEAREKLESLLAALGNYEIVKGNGSKWEKGTKTGLSFTANGACSKFTGVEVDGKAVDEEYYTAVSGSTIITLKAEYLETLSLGKHTLTVRYINGKASCKFEIIADTTTARPETGDNSNLLLWIVLVFVAGAGLFGGAAANRKRRRAK